ncbi:hypothetical protein PSEUDO8Z_160569 [Pseudomonas sp. 8Z]|nr:hypothetical protein PSEUDO8Z_160569 [Pseudomonas sp. 8Z]
MWRLTVGLISEAVAATQEQTLLAREAQL